MLRGYFEWNDNSYIALLINYLTSIETHAITLPDRARDLFNIPPDFEVLTGIAIGYQGDPMTLPEALKERDLMPRQRKPLEQFVFSGKWGNPSTFQ